MGDTRERAYEASKNQDTPFSNAVKTFNSVKYFKLVHVLVLHYGKTCIQTKASQRSIVQSTIQG